MEQKDKTRKRQSLSCFFETENLIITPYTKGVQNVPKSQQQ